MREYLPLRQSSTKTSERYTNHTEPGKELRLLPSTLSSSSRCNRCIARGRCGFFLQIAVVGFVPAGRYYTTMGRSARSQQLLVCRSAGRRYRSASSESLGHTTPAKSQLLMAGRFRFSASCSALYIILGRNQSCLCHGVFLGCDSVGRELQTSIMLQQ